MDLFDCEIHTCDLQWNVKMDHPSCEVGVKDGVQSSSYATSV